MITLSIDASTKSTGIAIFEETKLIHFQCIQESNSDTFSRIEKMVNKISAIYQKYKPTHIIMEDILPSDVGNNQKIYKALIYLQAAIVLMFHKNKATVDFYVASHWRSICGIKTGRGVKRDTLKQASIKLVKTTYNIDVNDDIADAICMGIAYIKQNRSAF